MGRKKGVLAKPIEEMSRSPQGIRRRLRQGTLDPEVGRELLGGKHIDDWDLDELARGRPRASDGTFKGPKPAWVTPQLQEEALTRFKDYVRGEMAGGSIRALTRIKDLIDDADTDRVRLDAAKFLLEYLIGKPTQEVKGNLQLNIQQILAGVLVNPDGSEAYTGDTIEDDEIEDAEILDDLDLDD